MTDVVDARDRSPSPDMTNVPNEHCKDEYCHICRPSRLPWEWGGPYDQYRWSGHLAKYPEVMIVKCDKPGCDAQAEVPQPEKPFARDSPGRFYAYAVGVLTDADAWSIDPRKRALCPKH